MSTFFVKESDRDLPVGIRVLPGVDIGLWVRLGVLGFLALIGVVVYLLASA